MVGGPFAQIWSYRGKIKLTFSFLFYNTPNPAISMSVAQSRCGFYLGGAVCHGAMEIVIYLGQKALYLISILLQFVC